MNKAKIKKVKGLIKKLITGTDIESEKLKEIVLAKLNISEVDYESPALSEFVKLELKKLNDKKIGWKEIEDKPDLDSLKYDDKKVISAIKKTREKIKEVGVSIPVDHNDLKKITPDDHHKKKHILESHTESELSEQLYRLVEGGYVDDLHKHKDKDGVGAGRRTGGGTGRAALHFHNDLYYTKTELLSDGILDTRYYTETELDAGQLDTRYYTEAEVDALILAENLWDRAGTILTTHTAGDSARIGDITNYSLLTVYAEDDATSTTGIFCPDVSLGRGSWIQPSGQDGVGFNAAGVMDALDENLWFQYYSSGDLNLCYGGGDIDANDADLDTTGRGTFGELDIDTLNFDGNVITDSTGTISFDNEDLITTGRVDGSNIISGVGINKLTVGTIEPTSPETGDLWLDTN